MLSCDGGLFVMIKGFVRIGCPNPSGLPGKVFFVHPSLKEADILLGGLVGSKQRNLVDDGGDSLDLESLQQAGAAHELRFGGSARF